WHAKSDGKFAHMSYTKFLEDTAQNHGMPKYFMANKGDAILWHANLVHYGSKIQNENVTRKSYLTHYCPGVSGKPKYFSFFDKAHKREWNDGYYSSRRYDLRPGINNTLPVYKK